MRRHANAYQPRRAAPTPRRTFHPARVIGASAVLVVLALAAQASFAPSTARDGQWQLVFADTFDTDVPLGDFAASAYAERWGVYPDGWKDTTGAGTYQPTRVLSVQNGMLDFWLRTTEDGPASATLVPHLPDYGQVYGKYSVRFRADSVAGYKLTFLLWPDTEVWPDDGEINFPEGYLDGTISGFAHHASADGGQDIYGTDATFADWHVATTEWRPGTVSFFLDDKLIGTSTTDVPTKSMHWVLQTETATDEAPPSDAAGHIYVDWVRAWSYLS